MSGHTEVGIAGLGVMGSAIARRLLRRGRAVRVYDIRPEAAAELAQDGATAAGSPARLAASGAVILSLNTADIVEEVVFGHDGVLSAAPDGVLVIDMSSIGPGPTRAFAERAAKLGAGWVDAPLSGGAPGAGRGELTLMLGGEEEHVERALPVLGALASRLTHLGPAGSGQLVKSVNQVLVGCGFAALAEAAALVRAAGLPPRQVLAALSGGRADSALLQEFFVKFADADLSPTGRVGNMVKDLEAARDYARSAGVPLPVTTAVAELHRWLTAAGHGNADNAALMHYYAPLEVRP
ncbi:NAD(P)-dependent oxidoreductase [Streptomyces phyllanthi]|uniref:NAD(P)-dependent oxidoreductase n=1 Tax=Streptomyces phyllanthi TaxID=1803180 RepID=A0A5N8WGN0_9ACTN|nr:NAD(P)-dependent oxidoreductase [Streptomyces phyllanthi]MPY45614.1 NAD(P)-dependent oxidoreductase [Streptomyces phyllanthi]